MIGDAAEPRVAGFRNTTVMARLDRAMTVTERSDDSEH
jgi:hypothetical protein